MLTQRSGGIPLEFSKSNLTGDDLHMTCMRVGANGFHGTILSALDYKGCQCVAGEDEKTTVVRLLEVSVWN